MEKLYTRNKGEFEIISKGRKYFHVKSINGYEQFKVNIETLKYTEANYSQNDIQFYTSLKEIEDETKTLELRKKVKNIFSGYGLPRLSAEQCIEILKIVEIESK